MFCGDSLFHNQGRSGGLLVITTHTLTESAIAELTRDAERRIHLEARKHSLESCATWLLQWETECGCGDPNRTAARFFLNRALSAARAAQEHWNAANGVKVQ